MASPRETDLSVQEPNAPFFARRVNTGSASLEKFSGVEAEYADISRGPTANLSSVKVAMDVPLSVRKVRFDLTNLVISVPAADDYASAAFAALPDRNILILNAEMFGTVVFSGDYATNDDPTVAIGSAPASNVTLSGAMIDVLPLQTFTNITKDAATAIAASKQSTATTFVGLHVPDAANTVLYLNVGNAGDILSDVGTATFNGYIDLYYIDLGNRSS